MSQCHIWSMLIFGLLEYVTECPMQASSVACWGGGYCISHTNNDCFAGQ